MSVYLSVVICAYNPDKDIFELVLKSLENQNIDFSHWELILIDNASTNNFTKNIDLSWKIDAKVIVETTPGLAYARICGFSNIKSSTIVFVDDDNVLESHYLEQCLKIINQYPQIGLFGGKAIPYHLNYQPNLFFKDFWGLVGCRDLGNFEIISNYKNSDQVNEYPDFAPIGTGMCINKMAFQIYLDELKDDLSRKELGRKRNQLTSGEDNDIVLTCIKNNFETGYFPQLIVNHVIPQKRTTVDYLSKMNFAQSKSWIKVLSIHQINPWKPIAAWTLPLRKAKAYFKMKAWASEPNYITWKGACGTFEGLAELNNHQ